ncbi:MAG: hypothetical protein ACNS64_07480 [Candidatus Halalkalibacterium sp. M3_1C_030]
MHKLIFLILFLATSGCQSITSSNDPQPGEEFELVFGEQISLDNGNLTITFKEVLEDSRCPEGVTCVWAGNAQVALVLNDNETKFNTYLEPQEITIAGFRVELISVSPYPVYEQDIAKEDYVARLVVSKI